MGGMRRSAHFRRRPDERRDRGWVPLARRGCYNGAMNTASPPPSRRRLRGSWPWAPAALLAGLVVAFATARPVAAAAGNNDLDSLPGGLEAPPRRAPEFPKGVAWLNSPPLTLKGLRGKVVLVDFWEYTCVNCIRTFPYLLEWDRRYRSKGLVIIGVHTPEFEFAKQVENVHRAAVGFGFKYPLAVDSDYKIWNAFGNRYWPAKYLIDKSGMIRDSHFGEGGYGNTEAKIQALLKEANPKVVLPPLMEALRPEDRDGAVCYRVTPELYAGSLRGELGSVKSSDGLFHDPGEHEDGTLYPHGAWIQGGEGLVHSRGTAKPEDYVALKYHALGVNAVLKPERGQPIRLEVQHDGKPVAKEDRGEDLHYDNDGASYVLVDQPRMYSLLKNAKFGQHTLKLLPAAEGLGLYSYTFVSCAAKE